MREENETTINIFGETSKVKCTIMKHYYPEKQKHTILHTFNVPDPEEFGYKGISSRPPHSVIGDDKENDKAWRQYNKAERELQMQLIETIAETGLIDKSIPNNAKFSRYAGCKCGCSSGWIVKDYGRKTIFITLQSPSKFKKRKEILDGIKSKQEEKTLASMVI